MATRLLPRNELDAVKAVDRKREIDEGVKLARKIDTLRIKAAEEERQMATFREASVAQTLEQTTRVVKVKSALEEEVKDLEARKQKALEPIGKEQEELERTRAATQEEMQALYTIKVQVAGKENAVDERDRLLRIEEQRVEEERRLSREKLIESDAKLSDANAVLAAAKAEDERSMRSSNEKEWNLSLREEALQVKEEAMAKRHEAQEKREAEQVAEHIRLLDREQTLLRNIKRNG